MQIRPYQGTDESALLSVWHAAMTADRLGVELFRTKVLLDPNFTPDNLPVAIVDGRVVGFALGLTRQVPLFLQGLEPDNAWITAFGVHPEYRQLGIGQALFQHLITRFKAQGRKNIEIATYLPNYFVPGVDTKAYPETIRFLENKLGFKTISTAISMGADLSGFQIPPDVLELKKRREQEDGLVIQSATAADLPDLMPFLVEHFGWDWFRHAQDYLTEYFGDSPHQICFLVARQYGSVVGFCQQRRERFGPFGVHPEKRNMGIGRLLLFQCLEVMSMHHVFFAYFLWTGEDAARLYVTAGFERRREFAILRKDIDS